MFDIEKKPCTLQHINIRDEKHGDGEGNVLAVDIKFAGDFDGDILAEFGAELRHALYKKADGGDLVDTASDNPTALRFPKMQQPLKFAHEIIGATVTVAYGLGDIVLETCDINNFRVECKDGGTVRVTYRVQAKPTGEQLAKLSQVLGSAVEVSIDPPEAANEAQQSLKDAA